MAKAKVSAKSLGKTAAAALDELIEYDFATGAQMALVSAFADAPKSDVAAALLHALADRTVPGHSITGGELTAFAGFLILAAGIDAARHEVQSQFNGTIEHLLIAEALGLSVKDQVTTDGVAGFVKAQAPALKSILTSDAMGPTALNQVLLEMPAVLRSPMVAAILGLDRPTKALLAFAALALLFPFDGDTKRHVLAWMAAKGGPEAQAFLAGLPKTAVDAPTMALVCKAVKRLGESTGIAAKGIAGIPIRWPVIDAFASPVDGQGSQGLYLVRQISSRKVALVGAVCNDRRGIAEGIAVPGCRLSDLREMVANLSQSEGVDLVAVPPEYIVHRIQAGIDQARDLQLPLPMSFQTGRYLLAGLPVVGEVDVMEAAREWADSTMLPDTHYLLHTKAGAAWYVGEEDGLTPSFFASAERALKRMPPQKASLQVPMAIANEADDPDGLLLWLQREEFLAKEVAAEVAHHFTPEVRRLWSQRLAEMAFWFDQDGRATMGDLAATAAVAMAPDSGVPLADQPLPAAMLRLSVLSHLDA
jgi:hypothetical protein